MLQHIKSVFECLVKQKSCSEFRQRQKSCISKNALYLIKTDCKISKKNKEYAQKVNQIDRIDHSK